MPRAPRPSESAVLARGAGLALGIVLLLGCQARSAPERRDSGEVQAQARASTEKPSAERNRARALRPAPTGDFDCRELRPAPQAEGAVAPETIELRALGTGKKVFTSKMGVVVTFDREEFLKAARCLKFEKAIRYLEEETGVAEESALMDAFQLSYVAAALLDAGRASVRLPEEKESRKSIARDGWGADGCAGRCRSFGRLYRLSDDDASFFLRITDQTRNDAK